MARETLISEALIALLDEHPRVLLPGIGEFGYRHMSASVDDTTHLIYPPMRSLTYSTTSSDSIDLIEIMEGRLKPKKFKKLKKAIEFAANELINFGQTQIVGLATIQRGEDGQMHITDIDPRIRGFYEYLPTIQLTPLASEAASWSKEKTMPSTKTMTSSIVEPSPFKKFDKPDQGQAWKPYVVPIAILTAVAILLAVLFRQCLNSETITEASGSLVKSRSTSGDSVNENRDTTAQMFSNPHLSRYQDVLTQEMLEQGCTIVVGSYTDRARARRSLRDVKAAGYGTDELTASPPYRVVIRFDCKVHDLEEYITEVRSEIEPKAWFLTPDYNY
ncbi:MAG: hypothetical protein AAFQ02_08290 [Bacteroidota bacterium]